MMPEPPPSSTHQTTSPPRRSLAGFFIVNAPWVFKPIWALARPFLNAKTAAKFHILGSNFAPTLLEYIDPSELPVEYGGTSTVACPAHVGLPDGYVCTSVRAKEQVAALARIGNADVLDPAPPRKSAPNSVAAAGSATSADV